MIFYILLFIFFSFVYAFVEVLFNAISRILTKNLIKGKKKFALWGDVSVWMLPFGGLSAVIINLFYQIPFIHNKINFLPLIMLFGAIVITLIELGGGILLNKKLKLDIWDYSNSIIKIGKITIPLNIMGQVDIYHFIGWLAITLPMCLFSDFLLWICK